MDRAAQLQAWKAAREASSENHSGYALNVPASSAKDLKAKLLKSAAKAKPVGYEAKQVQFSVQPVQQHTYQSAPIVKDESRLRSIGAMTPRTQAHVDQVMESNIRRAIETQAQVVRELCSQGQHDSARSALGGLRRVAPEVVELAEFWETALLIERQDPQRASTCMMLAMESIHKPVEKDALQVVLLSHFRATGLSNPPETMEAFFFPTGRRLSFFQTSSTSPQPRVSPVKSPEQRRKSPLAAGHVVSFKSPEAAVTPTSDNNTPLSSMKDRLMSIGKLSARLIDFQPAAKNDSPEPAVKVQRPLNSLRAILDELPKSEPTPMVSSPIQEHATEEGSPLREEYYVAPKMVEGKVKGTPYPRKKNEQAKVLFASPAVRVPTPKKSHDGHASDEEEDEVIAYRPRPVLQSRSPSRAQIYASQLGQEALATDRDVRRGSVVVLSPVKESSSSTKRIATPVRRSIRTATMSAEKKNQDALRRSEYTYVPNGALIDLTGAKEFPEANHAEPSKEKNVPETPGSVRRSARKTKLVEKLSPRLHSKFHN